MTTSNRLLGNISNIYKATALSPNFLSTAHHNYFPTAHLSIICLLQIDKIFHQWKLSKYFLTLHRKIVWELQIASFQTFWRFIWLLRKALFLGYCASIIFLLRMSLLFIYCKSSNYLNTANRLNIWLLCIEKVYDPFKSPISKHFDD